MNTYSGLFQKNSSKEHQTQTPFQARPQENADDAIKNVVALLTAIDDSSIGKIANDLQDWLTKRDLSVIESTRTPLLKALEDFDCKNKKEAKEIYNALITLTRHFPTNNKDEKTDDVLDPISFEPITNTSEKVYVSTGQIFDINLLSQWIKEKKEFVNPVTNLVFSPRDQVTIQLACTQHTPRIELLQNAQHTRDRTDFLHSITDLASILIDRLTAEQGLDIFTRLLNDTNSIQNQQQTPRMP